MQPRRPSGRATALAQLSGKVPACWGNVEIAEAIQAAQQARSERVQITQDDVLRGLHGEATFTGDGSSHAARVSAWAHIAKHLGMFIERRQQLGEDGQPVNPQTYTISISG
jgi:hypothetical protein